MRYKEIIQDWELVQSLSFTTPNFPGPEIGSLTISMGNFGVKKITRGKAIAYGIIDQDTNEAIGYVSLIHMGSGYYMAINAYIDEKALDNSGNPLYLGKGIMTSLFSYITATDNLKVLSDTEMTNDGAALWKSLVNQRGFKAKIYNLKTDEIFDIQDAGTGKVAADGTEILLPDNDKLPSPHKLSDRKQMDDTYQRYVYVLEGFHKPLRWPVDIGFLQENHWYGPGGAEDQP